MIYGIGTDLIETSRFKEILRENNTKFLYRVFSEQEITYCRKGAQVDTQAQCFAARFAAKEAFLKALGTGLGHGLRWKDIEIINDSSGKPLLKFSNQAEQIVQDAHIEHVHVSLSHTVSQASAIVILEK